MRGRLSVATTVAMLLGVLAGCTSGSGGGSTTAAPDVASSAPATPAPGPAGPVGAATAAAADSPEAVQVAGLDAATAAVLADTRSTVEVPDGHTFLIAHDLPTGDTVSMQVRLFAAPGADPTAPPVTESTEAPEAYQVRLRYSLATGSFPADLRAQVLTGLPDTAPVGRPATQGSLHPLGWPPVTPWCAQRHWEQWRQPTSRPPSAS